MGSIFTSAAHGDVAVLRERSSLFVLCISGILIGVAVHLGGEFDSLVQRGDIVGAQESAGSGRKRGRTHSRCRSELEGMDMVKRNGLMPGEVGYDGYDLKLFEGVIFDVNGDEQGKEEGSSRTGTGAGTGAGAGTGTGTGAAGMTGSSNTTSKAK